MENYEAEQLDTPYGAISMTLNGQPIRCTLTFTLGISENLRYCIRRPSAFSQMQALEHCSCEIQGGKIF